MSKSSRQEKNPFSGALLIHKESGPTSHDVVAQVRRIAGQKSVGHTGTLDPMASGLMILVLGEATKCSDLILNANKSYLVTIKLGVTTDTLDVTGTVLSEAPVTSTSEQIYAVSNGLQGDLQLRIPWYSAVKVNGQKFYEQAREVAPEELAEIKEQPPLRTMRFYDLEVQSVKGVEVVVRMSCSKGSFVRSWVAELGQRLGCGATMSGLVRETCGDFSLADSITIADLGRLSLPGMVEEAHPALIELSNLLPHVKGCLVNSKEEALLNHGQIPKALLSRLLPEVRLANSNREEITIKVVSGQRDNLLALLVAKPGQGLKFKRVFSYPELTFPHPSL